MSILHHASRRYEGTSINPLFNLVLTMTYTQHIPRFFLRRKPTIKANSSAANAAKPRYWWLIFTLLIAAQCAYWWQVQGIRPALEIVPPIPNAAQIAAESLGDDEWFFRINALKLQNFGDSFGRFTPLKHYDYRLLSDWWHLLDEFNPRSNIIPTLAGHYFSQSQHTYDNYHIVHYLQQHARRDPIVKWWWYVDAIYLANMKLKDKLWALQNAYELALVQDASLPNWTNKMPAFIHEQMGERAAAMQIIEAILQDKDKLKPEEIRFIRYFMDERMMELSLEE